jgi:CheY-like chemotaxis protein
MGEGMGGKKIKVLVVDDEAVVRDFLDRLLTLYSVEVKVADNGFKAIELARKDSFDLTFLDIRMPGIDGVDTFGELRKIDPKLNCVFMTGYAVEEDSLLIKYPGTVCLKKPFSDIGQIQDIINKIKVPI